MRPKRLSRASPICSGVRPRVPGTYRRTKTKAAREQRGEACGGYVHSRHLAGSGTEPWIEKWSDSPTYVSTEHAVNRNGLKM